MKTYYNLFKKGKHTSRTAVLKVAKNLEQLGWSYNTVHVYPNNKKTQTA